jgi:hypothetical protein
VVPGVIYGAVRVADQIIDCALASWLPLKPISGPMSTHSQEEGDASPPEEGNYALLLSLLPASLHLHDNRRGSTMQRVEEVLDYR